MGFSRFIRATDDENDLENGTNQVNSQSMANANNRLSTTSSNGSEEDDVVNLEENLRVSSHRDLFLSIESTFFLATLCEEE